MGKNQLRYAAGALCLALAAAVASVPFDTAAAQGAPLAAKETSWTHAIAQLPEMTRVVRQRHVIALTDAKTALAADVRVAEELFASSKGKATDESRRLLAVERNRAYSLVMVSDDEKAPPVAQEQLAAVAEVVTGEVAAWEAAEAARIAEEARVAAEAAAAAAQAAAQASHSSGRKASTASAAEAAGQTPQQYLEGIAGSYGGSISWTGTPCGRATKADRLSTSRRPCTARGAPRRAEAATWSCTRQAT